MLRPSAVLSLAAVAFFTSTVPLAASGLPAPPSSWFFDDFDGDSSGHWVVNEGPSDNYADFTFDYGALGIPPAPNSAGGTTRGLKLQTNLTSFIFGGFSVSPASAPIPEGYSGNYTLKVDWWSNYIGDPANGLATGAVGSTMLSTFGILTSGVTPNFPAVADSVFFAATGDGGSATDFRAYSAERPVSYQLPPLIPEDSHATYTAGSRNSSAPYYVANFPGGVAPPPAQQALYPETQFGTTPAGSLGFAWHEVTIAKRGSLVTWMIDGVDLAVVDMSDFTVPTGGANILLGYADINAGSSIDPYFPLVQFALFDNVRVVPEPTSLVGILALAAIACQARGLRLGGRGANSTARF